MGLLLFTYNLVSIAILVSPVRREKEDGAMWWEESWSFPQSFSLQGRARLAAQGAGERGRALGGRAAGEGGSL